MKEKRVARIERRRAMVQMNLISERTKGRLRAKRRGCLQPFAVLTIALGTIAASWMGLR